jgi:(p)ppGpp synthase/HD superfamily hydrolase
MDRLTNAKKYAIAAHGDQKYGGEFPYAMHLQAVESVLLRFGMDEETLRCAAWLHDVLEDTNKSYEELVTFFGTGIADTVADLTEPKGGNRKWRHEQTYPRTVRNPMAVVVKLADRIANVESGGSKVKMYEKEHADFKAALGSAQFHHPDETDLQDAAQKMWAHLDGLIIAISSQSKYASMWERQQQLK